MLAGVRIPKGKEVASTPIHICFWAYVAQIFLIKNIVPINYVISVSVQNSPIQNSPIQNSPEKYENERKNSPIQNSPKHSPK